MTCIAIFTQTCFKHIIFNLKGDKDASRKQEILANVARSTIVPLINDNFDILTVTEASMIMRGLLLMMNKSNQQMFNKVLDFQLQKLNTASNIELFGLLDIAMELNMNVQNNNNQPLEML